jgi:hypothetical protein
MIKRFTCILTCLLLAVAVKAQLTVPDSILFRNYPEQAIFRENVHEKIHGLDSLSIRKTIDDLSEQARKKGDKPLQYGIKLTWLRNAIYMGPGEKKKIEIELLGLIDELEEYNIPTLKAEAYYIVGAYYWDQKVYAKAFQNFISSYNIYSTYTPEEFPLKRSYLFELGGKYYHFRDFTTAKRYILQAYKATNPIKNDGLVTTLNTLSMCYMNEGRYDSAQYYIDKAYKQAVAEDSKIWQGILSGNLGHVYYNRKMYKEAVPLLEKDKEESLKGEPFSAANALALLSSIYLKLGDIQKAYDYAKHAMDIVGMPKFKNNYKIQKVVYPLIAPAFVANGDTKTGFELLEKAAIAKDSVDKHANALVLAGVQYNLEASKNMAAAELAKKEKEINFWIQSGLIIAIAAVLVIMLLIVNRQRIRYSRAQRKLEEEKKKAGAELEKAVLQLSEFSKILSEKNMLIEKFAADLRKLNQDMGIDTTEQEKALIKLKESTVLTDTQWKNFQDLFEGVYSDFSGRLKKKVRGLSPIETRFMVLSKLRLSDTETAGILGISMEAVSLNKHKLRERLGLPESITIENFADTI